MQHHRPPNRRLALTLSGALCLVACGGSAAGSGMDTAASVAPAAPEQPPSAAPPSMLTQPAAEPAAVGGNASPSPASASGGAPQQSAPASSAAGGMGCPSSAMSGSCPPLPAAGTASPAAPGALTLAPLDGKPLADGSFAFPASAVPPTNASPGFRFSGVPQDAKSLALVFRDVSSATPPVKWILWDLAPSVTEVPANLGASPHPAQLSGSSQLGSLGNQGYAGPCCEDHVYEWILYALDVASLPGTERLSTAQIRMNLLLEHDVAQSKPLMMRIMP